MKLEQVDELRASVIESLNALGVLVLTPHIREYLKKNDPKALEQAEAAIRRGGAAGRALLGEMKR